MTNKPVMPDWIDDDSARQMYLAPHRKVSFDLLKMMKGLKQITPHPIAYRKQGEDAYVQAAADHARRIHKLESIAKEIWEICEYIEPVTYYDNGKRKQDAT